MPFFGRKERLSIGVDLRHSGLKVSLMKRHEDKLRITGLFKSSFPPGIMKRGKVLKSEDVVLAINDLWKSHNLPKKGIVTAVPSFHVFVKRVRLPKMGEYDKEQRVRSEAEKYVSLPFLNMAVDYTIVGEDEKHSEVIIVAAPLDDVNQTKKIFERAGCELSVLDAKALALTNLFRVGAELDAQGKLVSLLDIGAELTTISIFKGGQLLYAKDTVFGSNFITEMIERKEGISFSEAEKIKHTTFKNKAYQEKLLGKFVLYLAEEIKRVLEGCKGWLGPGSEEIAFLFMTGGGADTKGLSQIFEKKFDIKVKNLYPLKGIEFDWRSRQEMNVYSVSIGLALRELT